ncbi:acetyltransferase [Chryseobacterium sp. 18068]|uniref:acetyltransferase n=1 Tax=Chryseobacterium sp. 18068 TaxID=2681414 RepID=UPI00135C5D1C|nr:acetyltransferase [Chryseobacterium sp. 18068]
MEDIQYSNETVIIGAGGLGRELVSFINNSSIFKKVPNVIGFIDDDKKALDNFDISLKVIDSLSENDFNKYESILLAINNSDIKRNIFSTIDSSKICGFIHHSCIIGDRAKLHQSVIVFPNVLVSCDTEISQGVFINCGSQIGHDVFIDEFTNIMANVDIGGNCKIGKNVMIGTGSTIYPGVKIADNTIIGAGSVVFRSIKNSGTYVGNPAKKIF